MRSAILIGIFLFAVLATAASWAIGVWSYESHSGYFAPVWSENGETIYTLRRSTSGFSIGPGWESLTAPASVLVISDRLDLMEVSVGNGRATTLATVDGSPMVNRLTRAYQGAVFSTVLAGLEPGPDGIRISARLSVPDPDETEYWSLETSWSSNAPFEPVWTQTAGGLIPPSTHAVRDGDEVLTLPGVESFNAGVIVVRESGVYAPVIWNERYWDIYSGGVSKSMIASRSQQN